MKKLITTLAPLALALWIGSAQAGVVLHQDVEVRYTGDLKPRTSDHDLKIDGDKARISNPTNFTIVDLHSNKTYVLHPGAKDYFDLPYPPPGSLGELYLRTVIPPALKYEKTGKRGSMIGYQCERYAGAIDVAGSSTDLPAHYSVTACYSTDTPGAKEYTAFVRAAASKADPKAFPNNGAGIPDGIPLESEIVLTLHAPAPVATPTPAAKGSKSAKASAPAAKASPSGAKGKTAKSTTAKPTTVDEVETTTTRYTSIAVQPIDPAEMSPPANFKGKHPRILGF